MNTPYKVRIELEFATEAEARKVYEKVQRMKNCIHALLYRDEYLNKFQPLNFKEAEVIAIDQEEISPYLAQEQHKSLTA
jgi:hypothetical protein